MCDKDLAGRGTRLWLLGAGGVLLRDRLLGMCLISPGLCLLLRGSPVCA